MPNMQRRILSILSSNKPHNNPRNNNMLLLTPAAKWRDGQNGRGQFFQCAGVLCRRAVGFVLCVRLGFVRDGLNTLELARVLKGQDHTGADRKHVELDCFNLP